MTRVALGASRSDLREFVPLPPIQHWQAHLLLSFELLLVEKARSCIGALIAQRAYPFLVHRTCPLARFGSDDHPVDQATCSQLFRVTIADIVLWERFPKRAAISLCDIERLAHSARISDT